MYANQLINEAEVQKTWGPVIEESTGITEKSKLSWMSKYCHYHNLNESVYNTVHLNPNMNVQSMGNATLPGNPGSMNAFPAQVTGSGDRPFSLLPLAMQVAAQTVGLDLVPVVPMQGPMGVLTYLDFVYGGGRGSGAPINGALDTSAAPLLIKFSVTNDDGTAFQANDVLYADQYNSSTTRLTPVAANNAFASYELTFVGVSRIDGLQIFRVRANNTAQGFATANTNLTATDLTNTGSNYAQGSELAASTIYNSIVNQPATGAGAAQAILYGLARVGVAARAGSATTDMGAGASITGMATIGAVSSLGLVKALEDHITGFSGNAFQPTNDPATGFPAFGTENINGNDPYQRGVGESTVDNIMGLSLFNKSVAAETFQVAAAVTREQVQDLKQFGIDAVAQVEAVLVNELTQSINKYILDRIFRNGTTNAVNIFGINATTLSASFTTAVGAGAGVAVNLGPNNTTNGNQAQAIAQFTSVAQGGSTQGDVQRRIYTKILAASNLIATRGRRGPATFAVTGGEMATALQSVAGFIAYPLSNTVNQAGGSLYPIGAIAGVTIYVDPNRAFNDYTICVGRKGDGNSPGLVFMPYLMAESVETIAEGTMAPKIAIKSRFALVDAGFNPELMYYTMGFNFNNGASLI